MEASGDTVAYGDTVTLHYRLSSADGHEFESTFGSEPATFTLGQGELSENLERWLIGLPAHETHVFQLEPEQAFGRSDPALVQRIALSEFPPDMPVEPRTLLEFTLPNGTQLSGTVLEKDANEAVVDFNHPLCDCPVWFEVEVLAIKSPRSQRPGSH
jgi:FKBP-type peptidyl-prolyl cis-trans isomerase SlpA